MQHYKAGLTLTAVGWFGLLTIVLSFVASLQVVISVPDVIIPECKRKKKPAEVAAEEEEEEEDDIEAEPSGTPSEEDESAVKGQILWLRGLNRLQTQVCRLLKAVSIA